MSWECLGWWGWRRRRRRQRWWRRFLRSERERRRVGVGGAENRLSTVAKEAAREEWTWLGFELCWVVVVVTFHC